MDLIRLILLELEKREFRLQAHDIDIEQYTEREISYHIKLMQESGLIEAEDFMSHDKNFSKWRARSITWQGQDYLESVREGTRWEKIKNMMADKALPMTIDAVKMVAGALLKAQFEKPS